MSDMRVFEILGYSLTTAAVILSGCGLFDGGGRPYNSADYCLDAQDYYSQGKYAEACRLYQAALKLDPDDPVAKVSYCFFLAACPDAQFRDGPKAVNLMESIQPDKHPDWPTCSTMAAVCAEMGNFRDAQNWQRKALSVCPRNVKSEAKRRLEMYECGHALRTQPRHAG